MDLATIGGLVIGVVAIVFSIVIDSGFGGLLAFVNLPSVFVTVGGGLASTMMSYKMDDFVKTVKIMQNTFSAKESSMEDTIRVLVDLSNKARREGLLALEAEQDKLNNEFIRGSLQLVVDGVEPDTIRETMELELANLEGRHAMGQGIFKTMAAQFPAWGMIGTLIGLINLLKSLDDPSALGPAMAVALITTFYGSVLANYICNPVAAKLGERSKQELQMKEMVIEGILSIQAGENPRIMENKLLTFLSPSQKAQYSASVGGAGERGGEPQQA